MTKHSFSLGKAFVVIAAVWAATQWSAPWLEKTIEHSPYAHLLEFLLPIAVYVFISFLSTYLALQRPLPSFVLALFFGQAVKPLLHTVIDDEVLLEGTVTLFATLILFQGGLETPLANFRRLFAKIFMLAFPGVLITAAGLAWATYALSGGNLTITTVVLLGAILASTDPAAVIPLFRPMKFRDESVKDIAISESAVNDVIGALLFFTFLGAVKNLSDGFTSIPAAFGTLASQDTGVFLLKQIGIGLIVGFGGWLLLRLYTYGYKRKELSRGTRGVALLTIPILSFFVAALFGGSGYLAAFIAGLLFHVSHEHEPVVEHYGENFIDGFAKPVIFILLGAMVDLGELAKYAGVGIAVALTFIYVLRPLMVFGMLGLLGILKSQRSTLKQMLFLSWIRETGAIPAVLLVTVVSQAIPGTEPLLPIGMWVILMTLIIQPPLTPWWAKKLGIAETDTGTLATQPHVA